MFSSIAATPDLARIRGLPRRVWQDDPDLPDLVRLLTKWLRYSDAACSDRCEGCKAKTLTPAQAVSLRELSDLGTGVFLPLRPGAGKTLVSLLAATVVQAVSPVLIVPAALEIKTRQAMRQYARHWRIIPMRIVTYEYLSHPLHLSWLREQAPDLIVCDESHKLKSTKAKCSKRLSAYLRAHPAVKLVTMSGSVAGRSIREYAHYLRWALGVSAPVPLSPMEVSTWSLALDEKVTEELRFSPGALLTLSKARPGTDLEQARGAYLDRLTQTPGVVSTLEDVPAVGLKIWTTQLCLPSALVGKISLMRETWKTPDGHDFSLALDLWRHARTLGCGLYYRWEPRPPPEWLAARRAWFTWANERLAHSRTLDSQVHLVERIKAGELSDGGLWGAWQAQRLSFHPKSVAVWEDNTTLRYAQDWLDREGGLCWVEQRSFGSRLSLLTGLPFFADQGLDSRGVLVDNHKGPAIVSIQSCREGHNLHEFHHKNLVTSPPSRGDRWEQLLARTHRDGQPEHEVTCEILLTCKESQEALAQAVKDNIFDEQTHGQPKKLCYAEKQLELGEI